MNTSLAFLFPAEEEKAGNATRSPRIALIRRTSRRGWGNWS